MSEKKNTIESLMKKVKAPESLLQKKLPMLWKNLILTLTRWILSMTTAQAIT